MQSWDTNQWTNDRKPINQLSNFRLSNNHWARAEEQILVNEIFGKVKFLI